MTKTITNVDAERLINKVRWIEARALRLHAERADRGGFADLENRESLWALLAVLTIRKALK